MVKGTDIPLRLGYVAVKNRSKQDILDHMPVKEALDIEEKWFSEHRLYGRVEPGYFGSKSLIAKLMKVLSIHIKRFLPIIKRDVFDLKAQIEARLCIFRIVS